MNLKIRKIHPRLNAVHFLKVVRVFKSCTSLDHEFTFWAWLRRIEHKMSEEQKIYIKHVREGRGEE